MSDFNWSFEIINPNFILERNGSKNAKQNKKYSNFNRIYCYFNNSY